MTDSQIQQTPQHPLERMRGLAERITLPASGIEVVIRKADVEAITQDSMKFALNTSLLKEVAQTWAKEAGEASRDAGQTSRPEMPLDTAEMLELARKMEVALLRNVVAAPPLDELITLYGGSDQLADFGMGSDYRALLDAVNRLNPSKDEQKKEQDKSQSAAIPTPECSDAEQSG